MWRKFSAAAITAALGVTPPPAVDSIAADAARLLAQQRHGAVAFSLEYRYTEHGPAHNVDRSATASILRSDGSVVKLRTADASTTKPTIVEDDYHLPIETRYLADYRFSAGSETCAQCPENALPVNFVSRKRDDEHGDGTMWVDPASHRIYSLHFHPSVLPAHTDSADIAIAFGQVLPDLWDIMVTEQQYNGHTLIFHGWGHVQQRQTNYRRFASLDEALTAPSASDASGAAKPQKTPHPTPEL